MLLLYFIINDDNVFQLAANLVDDIHAAAVIQIQFSVQKKNSERRAHDRHHY